MLAIAGLGAIALLKLRASRRPQSPADALGIPTHLPVLQTATQLLHPLLLLFSVFLVLVGHHEPGGGFVGGLVASAAFALLVYSHGPEAARCSLGAEPRTLAGGGLLVALGSGVGAFLAGDPFMRAIWWTLGVPGLGELKIGTPLIFDAGVYLVVLGVATGIVFALAESARRPGEASWK